MFQRAQEIIKELECVNVQVEKTFVSLKKIDVEQISLQLEFNFSDKLGFYGPVYHKMDTAEAWREWRASENYRSIFCKIIYNRKVPVVDNIKTLTAIGGLALGELEINRADCRKAACYITGIHEDFAIILKGRKAEELKLPIENFRTKPFLF